MIGIPVWIVLFLLVIPLILVIIYMFILKQFYKINRDFLLTIKELIEDE